MTSFVKFSFMTKIYRTNHVKRNNVIKVTNYEKKNSDGQQNEQSPHIRSLNTHTHTQQNTTTNDVGNPGPGLK